MSSFKPTMEHPITVCTECGHAIKWTGEGWLHKISSWFEDHDPKPWIEGGTPESELDGHDVRTGG